MVEKYRSYIFLLLILGFSRTSFAQCTVTVSITVTPDTVCEGNPVTISASPNGYQVYSFYINDTLANNPSAANTFMTSALAPGDSVTVTANNGVCTGNPSAAVYPVVYPIPVAPGMVSSVPSDTICSGDTVIFTASPPGLGLYYFYVGNSIEQQDSNNIYITNGLYNQVVVSVRLSQNGCQGPPGIMDTFTVFPTPFVTISPGDTEVCGNSPVTFTASSDVVTNTTYTFFLNSTSAQSSAQSGYTLSPPANGDVIYCIASSEGCTSKPSATDTVTVIPDVTATFTASNVCLGLPVDFMATSVPATGVNYLWNFGDGDTSSAQNPVHQYTYADSFDVTLIAYIAGCADTVMGGIAIYPAPVANFEAFPQTAYNDSSSPVSFINLSTNSTYWQWNFGDQTGSTAQSPTHVYSQTGVYTVTLIASNPSGCTDTIIRPDYIYVYPIPKLFIPNAFSPNGDGFNDILYVESTGVKYFNWEIFDRWGEKVFQSNDITVGWDGTYRGQRAPVGVYAYYLKVVFDDDSPRTYKGSVTLVR